MPCLRPFIKFRVIDVGLDVLARRKGVFGRGRVIRNDKLDLLDHGVASLSDLFGIFITPNQRSFNGIENSNVGYQFGGRCDFLDCDILLGPLCHLYWCHEYLLSRLDGRKLMQESACVTQHPDTCLHWGAPPQKKAAMRTSHLILKRQNSDKKESYRLTQT
jgi:hypothetical protein